MDKVINRYGDVTITINDDKEIKGQGGKSLLRILFESKYFIPSACGGKGTCGYCKLRVTDGGGDTLPTEKLILGPQEQREQYRLACQLKVKNDLKVIIPEEYLDIREYEGVISLSEYVTSDIKRVRITLQEEDEIRYKPGQYIQVKIPGEGEADFRAYSMASNPDQRKEVEINVKLIPEGIGSGYIHEREVEDHLSFSGPYGVFYLHTDSNRDIICVAGGVGLAPIKSIIMYWEHHIRERTLWMFYGARTTKDLYDHDYFMGLAEENDTFNYFPALSEEEPGWTGHKGFIHTVMKEVLPEDVRGESYLCGPPIMIDAATGVLREKGVPEERIWYDKF
jgi:Na+-transporting NADH:ubiquinone oxidoreductase subunit F